MSVTINAEQVKKKHYLGFHELSSQSHVGSRVAEKILHCIKHPCVKLGGVISCEGFGVAMVTVDMNMRM